MWEALALVLLITKFLLPALALQVSSSLPCKLKLTGKGEMSSGSAVVSQSWTRKAQGPRSNKGTRHRVFVHVFPLSLKSGNTIQSKKSYIWHPFVDGEEEVKACDFTKGGQFLKKSRWPEAGLHEQLLGRLDQLTVGRLSYWFLSVVGEEKRKFRMLGYSSRAVRQYPWFPLYLLKVCLYHLVTCLINKIFQHLLILTTC